MPEGDTIHRSARNLARALVGRPLTGYRAVLPRLDPPDMVGAVVQRVHARGKILLMHFDDGRVLLSHMKMTGSWHIYRRGEGWRKPPHAARVVMENGDFVAVCFDAPTLELLSPAAFARHPGLAALGPDLLAEAFDPHEAVRRLARAPGVVLGVRVLDQRAVAGIGNVYKSECLFLERLDPFMPVGQVPAERLARLLLTARRLMQGNLSTVRRTTRWPRPGAAPAAPTPPSMRRAPVTRDGAVWVYGRQGESCYACGTPIRMRRQGADRRSTYSCPRCQTRDGSHTLG